jgi:hypothetical protein
MSGARSPDKACDQRHAICKLTSFILETTEDTPFPSGAVLLVGASGRLPYVLCAAVCAAREEYVRIGCECCDECCSVAVTRSLVEWVVVWEFVMQSGCMGYECMDVLWSPGFEWTGLECDDERSGAICDGLTVTWVSQGACAEWCVCDGCEVFCRSVVLAEHLVV